MDIRVTNTKNRIQQGLLKCMQEKPFREIYSRDVIGKAEISSRTFYHYYSNKNDVLDDTEDEVIKGLGAALEKDRAGVKKLDHLATSKDIILDFENNFKETVDYFIKNKLVILTLLSENGDIAFLKKIHHLMEDEILARVKQTYGPDAKIKQDHNLSFRIALKNYVASLVNMVAHLLQYDDKLSPREMRQIIGKVQISAPIDLLNDQFE